MDGWADALRRRLGDGPSNLLGLDAVRTGEQFEELLGELTRWLQLKDINMRFASVTSTRDDREDATVTNFVRAWEQAERRGNLLETTLNETLFDLFGPQRFDALGAANAYDRLLRQLVKGRPQQFICATTNYDRSLEMALGTLKLHARTGFYYDGIKYPRLSPGGLGTYKEQPAVLHLHGAVGWYRTEDGEIIEHPAMEPYSQANGMPAVLYPSNNKVVEDSIVRAIWTEFDRAIEAATHILMLGHGLGDKHLVDRLRGVSVPLGATALTKADESKIKSTLPRASVLRLKFCTNPEFRQDMRAWMTDSSYPVDQ
jgi:hypothetical protein